MAAYLVVEIESVSDPEALTEYAEMVPELVARYGGTYLARGPVTVLEGDHAPQMVVLVKFESQEQMQALYDSSEYAPLKALRQRAASSTFLAIDAV